MGTLTAFQAVNMDAVSIWYGQVVDYGSTYIHISAYPLDGFYLGRGFTYNSETVTGGTVTGYDTYYYGEPLFSARGFSLTATKVRDLVQSGDARGMSAYALAGSDVFNGSSSNDLLLGYAGNDTMKGNVGNDTLRGNDGNDSLRGGPGKDTLVGNAGADAFRFDTAPGAQNIDRIADFSGVDDRIELENGVFTALAQTGVLSSAHYREAAGVTALDRDDFVLYDTRSGVLAYDPDGNGPGTPLPIATLWQSGGTHPSASQIGVADFLVT